MKNIRRAPRSEQEQKAYDEYMKHAEPALRELRAHGLQVETVGDLNFTPFDPNLVGPILLKWLPQISYQPLKSDIVTVLTDRRMRRAAFPILIEEYRRAQSGPKSGLAWQIGNALGYLADPATIPQLIELATNPAYGTSRQMVVYALRRAKDRDRVVPILVDLLRDPDVVAHALWALNTIRVKAPEHLAKNILENSSEIARKMAKRNLELPTN